MWPWRSNVEYAYVKIAQTNTTKYISDEAVHIYSILFHTFSDIMLKVRTSVSCDMGLYHDSQPKNSIRDLLNDRKTSETKCYDFTSRRFTCKNYFITMKLLTLVYLHCKPRTSGISITESPINMTSSINRKLCTRTLGTLKFHW